MITTRPISQYKNIPNMCFLSRLVLNERFKKGLKKGQPKLVDFIKLP